MRLIEGRSNFEVELVGSPLEGARFSYRYFLGEA